MRKQLIRTSKTKNVLYSSKHLADCLNYFENGGTK